MTNSLSYTHNDMECEKASNGYLMSLLIVMFGMPLPIINLLGSVIFFLSNRRSTWYVRWHCTQTLVSQLTLLICNSIGFGWTMRVIFSDETISNNYIAYIFTVILFNLIEFIFTISAAVRTRKGGHVHWWFWGTLTDLLIPQPTDLETQNPYPFAWQKH